MLVLQTTGTGKVAPGTHFTYDSDRFISHLSYLLNATTGRDKAAGHATKNMSALEWATRYFAQPLGIPNLYAYQGADPGREGDTPDYADPKTQVGSGGDQPLACRDFARVGQLLLNKGAWLDRDLDTFQLLSQTYVKEMFTVQFPGIVGEAHMPSQYVCLSALAIRPVDCPTYFAN